MCKLAMITGITDETRENAWMFVKEMAKEMSGSPEKDGFGYAAIDNEGELFGERWLHNNEAFMHRNPFGNKIDNEMLKKCKILSREKVYGSFGKLNDNIRSITLHSRMATNTVNYRNTHPFVEDYTSVVHNGVISNDAKLTKKYSTCDSEVILHEYIKYNVGNKPHKFQKVANKLEGYYALGIFSRTSQGRVILDVVKDGSARLDAFFVKELNCLVFATPKWSTNPVEDVCKKLGFTVESKYKVKDCKLQRFDAMTGEPLAYLTFKPKERTYSYPTETYYGNHGSRYTPPYTKSNNTVEKTFEEVFKKDKEEEVKKNIEGTKIIETESHSKAKHEELVKDRMLDEVLSGSKEYTKEEVDKLMGESKEATEALEKFNEDETGEWTMDSIFTWHKRTLS